LPVALVTPPPMGSINGNIPFDSGNHLGQRQHRAPT
jgi:hypothetical protein